MTGRLAAGSIPAAAITIFVLSSCPRGATPSAPSCSHGLGFALMLTAIAILFGRKLREYASRHEDSPLRQCCLGKITVAVGALLGVLVTISSVGAGALGVAALFFLYPKLSPVQIVGSRCGARRAADLGRRPRSLAARQRRLVTARSPAARLAARHLGG